MKCPPRGEVRVLCSRSPCGERGLKLDKLPHQLHRIPVAPRAGSVG